MVSEDAYISACLEFIRNFQGVADARVVTGSDGKIAEISVDVNTDRNMDKLRQEIVNTTMSMLDLIVNRHKISLRSVGTGSDQQDLPVPRPRIVSITAGTKGLQAEARVEIIIGDKVYVGETIGPNSAYNRNRLLAEAALAAVSRRWQGEYNFVLEDTQLVSAAGKQVALVTVTMTNIGGEETLVGASLVRSNVAEALVKATLDAINRQLRFL